MNLKNKNINFLNHSDLNFKIPGKRLIIQSNKSNLFKNIYSYNKNELDEPFTKIFYETFKNKRGTGYWNCKLKIRYFLGLF